MKIVIPTITMPWRTSRNGDYITPLQATREYFDLLETPAGKKPVLFEESAHMPFMAEPERFSRALVDVKETEVK